MNLNIIIWELYLNQQATLIRLDSCFMLVNFRKANEFSQATYIILYLDSLHNRNLAIRPSKPQLHGLHCATRFSIRLPEMSMATCHEIRDLRVNMVLFPVCRHIATPRNIHINYFSPTTKFL